MIRNPYRHSVATPSLIGLTFPSFCPKLFKLFYLYSQKLMAIHIYADIGVVMILPPFNIYSIFKVTVGLFLLLSGHRFHNWLIQHAVLLRAYILIYKRGFCLWVFKIGLHRFFPLWFISELPVVKVSIFAHNIFSKCPNKVFEYDLEMYFYCCRVDLHTVSYWHISR